MNQAEYFLANQADGELTEAQTSHMLGLPEGDTPKGESGEPDTTLEAKPAAEVAKVDPAQEPAAEKQPVILAKDGVHTIPFEKLEEARQDGQRWKNTAADLMAQVEAHAAELATFKAKTAAGEKATAPAPVAGTEEVDFGDYSDEAIRAGVEKLVDMRVKAATADLESKFSGALEPIQKERALTETEKHFSAIEESHSDFEAVVESKEMTDWIAKQPSFVRDSYKAVIQEGTAPQVIELLDTYKQSTGIPAATGAGKPDVVAAAKAAIDKAQSKPPTSLTEIPSGSTAAHDPAEAIQEMSEAGLMTMFENKTPEQINALLARSL
jgi:hypothetical protein